MRINQLEPSYIFEGIILSEARSARLWESAGRALAEAQLTPDQIQQIFQQAEQSATAAGGNRTMLGKGKDAAAAVNKAWEDLKTKVQNSGPIKNVDSAYDSAVAKIEAGLGGPDNAVNQVIQKYRAFAKAHPIAQGLIYSALIAAAGISGAGLGGAAVLGLLKMTDKLLQGEKFSSAAYQGGKTGAMAYAAGQIGKAMRGDQAPNGAGNGNEVPPDIQKGLAADQAFQDSITNKFPPGDGYQYVGDGSGLQIYDATGRKVFTGDIPLKTMDYKTFADLTNNGQMATPGITSGSISSDPMAGATRESVDLSESQINRLFRILDDTVINEGILDKVKQFGKNLTTKITADKLNKAWIKAGKPTDSEEVKALLSKQGVDAAVIDIAFKSASVTTAPAANKAAPAATSTALAGGTDGIKKWYQSASPAERAELRKALEIIDDQDRLATGTNESLDDIIKLARS